MLFCAHQRRPAEKNTDKCLRYGEAYDLPAMNNRASLITSAFDFVNAMNWNDRSFKGKPVQTELFPDLTDDEDQVYQRIRQKAQGVHISTLMTELNMPYPRLSSILFSLEMKLLIKQAPGSLCKPL